MSERLQKVLAGLGLGSRREIEGWIAEGRLRVNGQVAKLGDRVESSDRVSFDGRTVHLSALATDRSRVLIYHKPVGEVCTRKDPEGRPSIFEHLPALRQGRWILIGRLDLNTSGLLLLTNEGELAHRLMHPSSEIEREYAVRILGEVDEAMIKRLQEGVELDDGEAAFASVRDAGGTGANHWYHVV
ncbi:MAG: pseudouridine synthase, partial [Gammaproteobacteria bacterium]|nr:pseudouridine synthase [Gammaproteobacteria bacterium]